MSVESIILGILREPSTGYQIKRDFDQIFSNFWSAEQSQIYRTLRSLEKRGLVEGQMEPPEKGPPRRVYRRTAAGTLELREWLGRDAKLGVVRLPYLAQLFFLDQLDDLAATERLLERVCNHHRRLVASLEAIDLEWTGGDADYEYESDEDFHAHLVLEHGLARGASVRDWAERALAATRRRSEPTAVAKEAS